jgi:SAM-dependent methyltransferase
MQTDRPYREAAPYYHARPPYSSALLPALAERLGWDGTGRLLDLGCGPGVLARQLAPGFATVVGLDAEEAMLDEARAATAGAGDRFSWVQAYAEDLPALGLGAFQAVSLGQSFHWMDREVVARHVRDALIPCGAMVLVHHDRPSFDTPQGLPTPPPAPPIPHDEIWALVDSRLGPRNPAFAAPEPYADLLLRMGFTRVQRLLLPGRTDLLVTSDHVIDTYLSTSFAAPDRFGDALPEFRAEVTALLRRHSPDDRFLEWPGDTEVILGISG